MIKGGIICFFFVNDVVFTFRKRDTEAVNHITSSLKKHFTITEMGDLKWFLGMHIFRDRSKHSLWLSQRSYIEKLANEFILGISKLLETQITDDELLPLPIDKEVDNIIRTLYQRKI